MLETRLWRIPGFFKCSADPAVDRVELTRQLLHQCAGDRTLHVACGRLPDMGSSYRQVIGGERFRSIVLADPSNTVAKALRSVECSSFDHGMFENLAGRLAAEDWAAIRRVLRPGGQAVFFEPANVEKFFGDARAHRFEPVVQLARTRSAPSRSAWSQFLQAAGDCSLLPRWRPMTNIYGLRKPLDGNRPRYRDLCRHDCLERAVSVVVPCYKEAANGGPFVEGLHGYYGKYLREIVLVDDHSTDQTRAVLHELAATDQRIRPVFHDGDRGVGGALAAGYRAARGKYVLSMDCDFQRLLPDVCPMFDAAAAGHDVIFGSRFQPGTYLAGYPLGKLIANRGFHAVARLLFTRSIHDVTNNLRLVRRDVLLRLRIAERGFAANAEIGLQPYLMGLGVKDVPMSWIGREPGMGTSSFPLLQSGPAYVRVLWNTWLARSLCRGPYRSLVGRIDRPLADDARDEQIGSDQIGSDRTGAVASGASTASEGSRTC